MIKVRILNISTIFFQIQTVIIFFCFILKKTKDKFYIKKHRQLFSNICNIYLFFRWENQWHLLKERGNLVRRSCWKCKKMKNLSLKQKKERSQKAMQAKCQKERENMTPQEIHDFKEKEAARISALRNKKRAANEHTKKKKKHCFK